MVVNGIRSSNRQRKELEKSENIWGLLRGSASEYDGDLQPGFGDASCNRKHTAELNFGLILRSLFLTCVV